MIRQYLPKNIRELVHWYERYVSPLSLVAGFVADNLILLRRVDLWTTNALFLFYLVVASCGILLINLLETGRTRTKLLVEGAPVIPVVVQFAFGGLFSGFLSLYSRSAAYTTSWIFVLLVAGLLLGNERLVRFYVRFRVQISILFTTLFSFLIFFLPVVFHTIGTTIFLIAGACALTITALFCALVQAVSPLPRREIFSAARSIAIIYVAFNVLYFTNAIPPLPLSLKDAGVYHSVVHNVASSTYEVAGEEVPWYAQYLRYNNVFHVLPGGDIYVYTAIFAPSGLSTDIMHKWQHYDSQTRSWDTVATIQYPIQGGRDGGYEGYSYISNPEEGAWRVDVVTEYGQIIGRVAFSVVAASSSAPYITQVK